MAAARTRDGRPWWQRSTRPWCSAPSARDIDAVLAPGQPPEPLANSPPVPERSAALLSLVLPKGSLERATLELFDAADLTVRRSSDRDYHASIDDPRIDRVRFLRPQEIPSYIERGLFDLGITGRDWIG